ncbi:MAG: hypothetical protein HY512_00450 [Candidatus Aenigmarchaeota archaeon]|nr:hypothetical protein [Candidatus Aenigmarchaeota archaeon]
MNLKTIKIGDKSYKELNRYAGLIRSKENRPVSVNEAILRLLAKNKEADIMRFAGSWTMTDKEFEKIEDDLKGLWKTWKVEL